MRRLSITLSLLILSTSLLTSCGFHLRGSRALPDSASPMYIAAGETNLRDNLEQVMDASGVELVDEKAQARLVLRVLSETQDKRTLSVDNRGKVVEYELHYQVQFDGVDAKGISVIPRQSVDLVRSFLNEDIEVLGKQEEAQLLREDMENEMANRLVFRLRAQLK